jgi:hypothetical protein
MHKVALAHEEDFEGWRAAARRRRRGRCAAAGFFVGRYANMPWSILTPELSLHWDGATLR